MSNFVNLINSSGILDDDPFVYVDAGCSNMERTGLLQMMENYFGKNLTVFGFDAMNEECYRLQEFYKSKAGTYIIEPAMLTGPKEYMKRAEEDKLKFTNDNWWHRTWTSYCINKYQNSESEKYVGFETSWTDREIILDDYLKDKGNVDFIKIDIDQPNAACLEGCLQTLKNKNVYAVELEVHVNRPQGRTSNSLVDVGLKMIEQGYTICSIGGLMKYSKRALPSPFVQIDHTQTKTGQHWQCDVLFVKDHYRDTDEHLDEQKLIKKLKLCCLYMIYNLSDIAAEILLKNKKNYNLLFKDYQFDVDILVDVLCKDKYGVNYKEHISNSIKEAEQIKLRKKELGF